MPNRARSHILEDQSIRRFRDALPPDWVYRVKVPDYGIDGEIEIFDCDGTSTGLTFNVQLRATDDASRADRVRIEIDELDYYRSLDVPTAVVRYCSQDETLFWQWASNIGPLKNIVKKQKTLTYRFTSEERWTEVSSGAIRRTLCVRRSLANFSPSMAVPLRIDLSAIASTDRYPLDRAITYAIGDSSGALVRADSRLSEVEVFARLEPSFLTVGIDTLTGVTFDLKDPMADDYLTSILYALVYLFRRQRLFRQAEALATLLVNRGLAHHDQNLAFHAIISLEHDLPLLVRLAIINGIHDQGPLHALIPLTITKAPQNAETRRAAMDAFFNASLTSAGEMGPTSEAAVHYSIGNFYRSLRDLSRAVHHYNRARHLRPAYLQAGYFFNELAGVLFLGGHFRLAQRFYRDAAQLDPADPNLVFCLGDALLLSGAVSEARACYEEAHANCTIPRLIREAGLKAMVCNRLIVDAGLENFPRRRAVANSALQADGSDSAEHLEFLLRYVDAFHPLIRFNLGVARAREGDHVAALYHFLACAFIQPHDISAWANAAICALGLGDEVMLHYIMSTAIHHMCTEAYDHFRADIAAQGIEPQSLALLDELAMQLLGEREKPAGTGFTVRMLDGDTYHAMTILGSSDD